MPATARLALLSLLIGGVQGLLVLGAAAAAGRPRKLPYWLAGTAWGLLTTGMLLSDCAGPNLGPSAFARAGYPVFFAGLAGFPVALVWGQRPWVLRWLLAQVVLLVSIAPAFLAAVVSALCSLQ
ncbi:MAG TPA: hypothetical protein VNT75_20655 [Symbiobacteriaceae bacterium]|nr:hypothetical protein [Symbiobacteriaceae bacterium]